MCIGRLKEGMVKEPVWKTDVTINEKTFIVKIGRPRRNMATGKSVYLAQTQYNGEVISVDKEAYSIDDALMLMRNRLKELLN